MPRWLAVMVEGHSEVESIPVLLRRIFGREGIEGWGVCKPFRVHRYQVVRPREMERAMRQMLWSRPEARAALIVMDSDDDCPAWLGPALLDRCRAVSRVPAGVALAKTEFEAWLLGAAESLRGFCGIREDAISPQKPEGLRQAKERLDRIMKGHRYVSVDDQPYLAARMDLALARERCPSFDKFYREVCNLTAPLKESDGVPPVPERAADAPTSSGPPPTAGPTPSQEPSAP